MRYQADYQKAVVTAEETLELYSENLMPLRLELLIDQLSNEIKLISYSRFMEMHHLSLADVVQMLDSDLGACVCKPDSGQYLILYNDSMSTDVCRFTIGHELGHIFLKHHEMAGSNILSRTFVSKEQYEEFEKEANVFSRNLLSPASLANLVNKQSHGHAVQDISRVFYISPSAAKVRIDCIKRDLRYLSTDMISFLSTFHAVRYTWLCSGCHVALPRGALYCPVCGTPHRKAGYAYTQLPADEPSDPSTCPQCGNQHMMDQALYCHICGTPAKNLCDNGHINPSFAHFCMICGQRTRSRHIKTYSPGGKRLMEYGPQIPYNEKTLRVKSCPKCLYKRHLSDAEYCIMCGTDLYNRCDANNMQQEEHFNPPNARFCYRCGRPTAYAAFLPAFTEMLAEQRDQFDKELSEVNISPALHNRILGTDDSESGQESSPPFSVEPDELPF